ncbi:MAG TPA: HNH endonuclease signature motif containing protein [Planctomycetota bacterium]|nr:HNH endonuclease signature motif containing protein [Planctomycetota bacterium]
MALSAEENDRLLVECFLTGSHASLGFARLLLELHETRRYIALGFPSTAHYAEIRFRIARTQAMEHIIHRVHGGRTEPANELTLCAVCHALIHEGRLGIEGDMFEGFRFFSRHECMRKSIKEIGEKLLLSKISNASESGIPDSASGIPDSGPGDSSSGFDVELLASGLVNIGYREKDAIQAISRAIGRLASDSSRKSPITEQEIFKEAVRRGGRR